MLSLGAHLTKCYKTCVLKCICLFIDALFDKWELEEMSYFIALSLSISRRQRDSWQRKYFLPGNPHLKGKLITVDLLIKFDCFVKIKIQFQCRKQLFWNSARRSSVLILSLPQGIPVFSLLETTRAVWINSLNGLLKYHRNCDNQIFRNLLTHSQFRLAKLSSGGGGLFWLG